MNGVAVFLLLFFSFVSFVLGYYAGRDDALDEASRGGLE